MALDMVRKISFKPASRRSSHVRTGQDRLAQHWTRDRALQCICPGDTGCRVPGGISAPALTEPSVTIQTEVTDGTLISGDYHLESILAARSPLQRKTTAITGSGPLQPDCSITDPSQERIKRPPHTRRPHQRIRAGCVEALVKDCGRALAPYRPIRSEPARSAASFSSFLTCR